MRKMLFILLAILITLHPVLAQRRALTVEDLWSMRRVGEPVLSPNGEWLAFTITQYEMESNGRETDIFLVSSIGGAVRQLTTHTGYDGNPCWSPDGSILAFLSNRDGSPQIYAIQLDGGEAQKISNIPTGINDFLWSPDGKYFAFTTDVYPEASSLDASLLFDQKRHQSSTKARLIDGLFYRHWNHWNDEKRSHVFVMSSNGGDPWDVTPGHFDTPPISLGGMQDYVFSPDGEEIAFVRNTDPILALSTNNDIFVVSSRGGTIRRITQNPANDNQPVYSPDGQYIAYRSMERPGFEADQYDLMLYHRQTGSIRNLTNEFDLDIDEIVWAHSSEKIYFTSGDQQGLGIFSIEIKNEKIKGLVLQGCNRDIMVSPDDDMLFFRSTFVNLPDEIFSCNHKGEKVHQITHSNQTLLQALEMNSFDGFWFPSYDNRIVHGLILKPPFFDPAKTYPAILLIHGGPQGAWRDQFHYRWNAQLFASRGYVVILINPRGSKGYGQEFCDAVSKNWGGSPYRDIMVGLDYAVRKYKFIDANRIAAAGGSYGGYMVNWIAGHTNRFRCLISHAGISDLTSFYGATEELWFPEWEFDGPPHLNSKHYEKWSPLRYAKDFVTPTLVVHGQLDYRVPVTQGFQMFTALQRQKIPSRLLYFPDEGHFIQKPQNARLWWNTLLDWIDAWIH